MTVSPDSGGSDDVELTEDVVVAHTDAGKLMDLATKLAGMHYRVTALDAVRPLPAATRAARDLPSAIIVSLTGLEPASDVTALMDIAPMTKFLFLVPELAGRDSLMSERSVVLGAEESSAVVVASLITLLARRDTRPSCGG